MTQLCIQCTTTRPAEEFPSGPLTPWWTTGWCTHCLGARNAKARPKPRTPDEVKAAQTARYRDNKDLYVQRARQWQAANPERFKELSAAWRASNTWKTKAHSANRAARQSGSEGVITEKELEALWVEQEARCAACQVNLFDTCEVDHWMPLSRSGLNKPENLQLLCRPCNRSKASKHPVEWAKQLGLAIPERFQHLTERASR